MRRFMLSVSVLLLALCSCGYTSKDNELIGQAKKVRHETPIICPDYANVDISLGVMRNGVGSMSTQDKWLLVRSESDLAKLKKAVEDGSIVKIKYDEYRVAICTPNEFVTSVEIVP